MPAYRKRIAERFCLDSVEPKACDIWVHTVSLGEVIAATPLIEILLQKKYRLLITTTTPSGSNQVQTRFKDQGVIHRYLPIDLPDVIQRFFNRFKPKLGIILETEIWPNLIAKAQHSSIPLLLINARLSPQSYQHYKKLRFFFKPTLNQFHNILAQSAADAKRFIALGAESSRVSVLGNLKFDLYNVPLHKEGARTCQTQWGEHKIVVMAASTHEDEESQVLSEFKRLQQIIPDVLLLIAPRHPERFQSVFQLATQMGFNTGLRSESNAINPSVEVVILNTLGELISFYAICHFAFVGGSLAPIGGHNVLEPIAMEVPVLTGPYHHNFQAICDTLREANAVIFVKDAKDLITQIGILYQDPLKQKHLVANATQVFNTNKGVINRYVEKIEGLLDPVTN